MRGPLTQPLAVTALGAFSSVGTNLAQTCTSIRAGLCGLAERANFETLPHDPEWDPGGPLAVAACEAVAPEVGGWNRLLALAVPPLHEVLGSAAIRRADLGAVALLLALPAPDEAVGRWGSREAFGRELLRVTGLGGVGRLNINTSAHTGVFELAAEAADLLAGGHLRHCLLLGVDSYLGEDRLVLWDRNWRVRSERNPDGFLPGEAACALLLERPADAQARGRPVRALVRSLGFGHEPNNFSSDKQSSGAGLCQAVSEAMREAPSANWVCSDLNGESYRAFEWGTSLVRLHQKLGAVETLHHPAECVGEVGAATGALLTAHAAFALGRPNPPSNEALLLTSADDGARAALWLTAPDPR